MSLVGRVLRRLCQGDETAFRELVRQHHGRLIGLAQAFVGNHATAEEVVQETWLAVIEGVSGLNQPSSLKSWIYTILANKARRRAVRDGRMTLFSDIGVDEGVDAASVDPDRFTRRGFWKEAIALWDELDPERIIAGRQLWRHVMQAVDDLPPSQRAVVLLHDVEDLGTAEVCEIVAITENHQRVLLHRARARLRQVVETLLSPPKP